MNGPSVDIEIIKIRGKKIGCCSNKIDFSKIKNHTQLLNIRNEDMRCILYCIEAFFSKNVADPENPSNYESFIQRLNIPSCVNFPCDVLDLEELSEANMDLSFAINLFKLSQGNPNNLSKMLDFW